MRPECVRAGLVGVLLLVLVLQPVPALTVGARELQEDFVRAAEQVSPAVVSLKCLRVVAVAPFPTLEEEFFRGTPFEGFFRELRPPAYHRQVGQGSGVIIDRRGLILTNHHVVVGAQQIAVHLQDGRTLQGQIVGSDPRYDLALIRVPATNQA